MPKRLACTCVCFLALVRLTVAQEPTSVNPSSKATLEGTVTRNPGGDPIKKAIVELIAEEQEAGGNYTATSDQEGHYKITDIQPGRYKIFVERTGFIEVDAKRRRSEGAVLSLSAGKQLKDRALHMQAAAIITGRVVDEDGDPMANVEITVLKRKAAAFEANGSAQTNDLGEYRIGGLLAGKYLVAASPMPNFQSLVRPQKSSENPAAPVSSTAYVTTYYPGLTDRAQASAIELHAGEEMPVDFSLTRRHAARIRGRVSGLATGSKAVVILRGKGASTMFNAGEIDKDGKFEVLNVSPGTYTLTAMTVLAETPQMARQMIDVSSTDVDDLNLVLAAPATIRGQVRFTDPSFKNDGHPVLVFLHDLNGDDESGVMFSEEEGAGSATLAKVKPDGTFELKNVPPGLYEMAVTGDARTLTDTFVQSLVVGAKDFVDTGLEVGGGTLSVDLTVSAGAGVADGVVTSSKNEPIADAVVVAVPEARFRKQTSRYQRVSADQTGHFTMRGLRPGTYTLYAWETLEDDDYTDPEFLKSAEGHGTALKVEKSSHLSVELKVIVAAEQP